MSENRNVETSEKETSARKAGSIALSGELKAAVDHAYDVFAPYAERFSASVCMCPCCFSQVDKERLIKLPLREIDGYLLDQYSWSAHGHDDNGPISDDLRYLLPRYFELLALNHASHCKEPEWYLTKLGRTAYRSHWLADEVMAIDRYFDALMSACLTNDAIEGGWPDFSGAAYRCVFGLDRVLGMTIPAGADVDRLLRVWDSAPDPAAALHMANQRFSLVTDDKGTRIRNRHFEQNYSSAAYAVGAFVTSRRATERIEAAFFETIDKAAQKLLSDALFLG